MKEQISFNFGNEEGQEKKEEKEEPKKKGRPTLEYTPDPPFEKIKEQFKKSGMKVTELGDSEIFNLKKGKK